MSTIEFARFKVQVMCRSASFGQQSLLIGFFFRRKIHKERLSQSILSTIKGKSPCTPPREFIIIPRLSQAQRIWNANELVRIKKSLWSETSPNLLQDKRYTAMAYTPSLPSWVPAVLLYLQSNPETPPPTRTRKALPPFMKWKWCKQLMLPNASWTEVLSWGRCRAGLQDDRLPSLAINYSAAALALRLAWSLCRQGFLSSQALCSLQRASFACKIQPCAR